MTIMRLVKAFMSHSPTGHQREEFNCLGQSTIAWCLKQNYLSSTLLYRLSVSLELASYHCFASVVGQERDLDHDTAFLRLELAYFECF